MRAVSTRGPLPAERSGAGEVLVVLCGSNGGLLVGAALTQWPELYRAVVCSAPLLDMVRYEQYLSLIHI